MQQCLLHVVPRVDISSCGKRLQCILKLIGSDSFESSNFTAGVRLAVE
jgi:hypothetical protein